MVGGIQPRLAIVHIIVVRDITTIRLNSRMTEQFIYTPYFPVGPRSGAVEFFASRN